MATVQEAFFIAFNMQGKGQLAAAADIYNRILQVCPDHLDTLHMSGLVARRRGDVRGGAERIRRVIALNPAIGEAWNNLANALRDLRQLAAAAIGYRRASILNPALAPAYAGLAGVLRELGPASDVVALWRTAVTHLPDHAETRNGLGNALQDAEDADAAVSAYRTALALDPGYHAIYANLGAVLRSDKKPNLAADQHRRALRLCPDFAAALSGLGLALTALDRSAEAVAHHDRAIAVQPEFAGAYSNRGSALLAGNHSRPAVTAFRRSVAIDPTLPDPHRNLGIALLLEGRFDEAWPEYDWRFRCKDSETPAELPRPRWDGGPLNCRTILLYTEQGLGDALHFVRYVPMVAAKGGRVILCAPRTLERLVAGMPGVSTFIPAGEPISGYDVHCPLLSLPMAFATTLETIPANVPYLYPDPGQAAAWKARLAAEPGFKVGIVWAGSPGHGNNRNRSLKLSDLAPLAAIPGVRLISLQKGEPAEQAKAPPAGMDLVDMAPEITDFGDTAAIVANLDLVIAVDTSVAHLAGALGRPVWVLVPFAPDWRWLLGRSDSPWYPTMRLLRQPQPGAWGPVLERTARDLQRLATGGTA